MFRNNYQGGAVVEIFSGQGKDPVAKWKLCGGPSSIRKEYDKEVKGFVYCLEGSSQTVKMQMPENGKMSLGLLQRFLVLQVNIPSSRDFSVELVITDLEHLKRRLHLSTVHKEVSVTPLHAKIPVVLLRRNVWSTLCIDHVSFTSGLFKGFVTLDAITLFATCKVRRIFTMKTEPTGTSEDAGAGFMDLIPRSCHFPAEVNHVTQVLNMENLQKADMRAGPMSSDCVSDLSAMVRSTTFGRLRPQGVLQTTSGSRVSGLPTQSGRKSSAASHGMDKSDLISSTMGSSSSRMKKKVTVESQRRASMSESVSHGQTSHILLEGTPGNLLPHPPKDRAADKTGSKKMRVSTGAGRGSPTSSAHSVADPGGHGKKSKTREKPTPPSSRQERRQQPLTLTDGKQRLTAGSPDDLQVCSSRENNEGSEPQLTLQGEVFTFLSQPHSPRRAQGQGNQGKMEMGNDLNQGKGGRRHEAGPEDDFIGSESDEEKEDASPKTVDSSGYHSHLLSSQQMYRDDEEELRMLASLKREQEEDECRASGLSASQIHQCNVSISMSSDDTSNWTHISLPTNQGHHYQKEMNPLLQSNPREWMDVLSPPIMPPSQQRRSGSTRSERGNVIGGGDGSAKEEEDEEECLNLFYDPCLNCYFDPKTGKYYELA
ncbi:uncharacterized protein V6R79_016501 [Siganus canaliculatus]